MLKCLRLLIQFSLTTTSAFAFGLNVDTATWTPVSTGMGIKVFSKTKNSDETLSVIDSETPETRPALTDGTLQNEIKLMSEDRSFTNTLLGRSDWKVDDSQLIKAQIGQDLFVTGTFSVDDQQMRFSELHCYREKHVTQIQLIEEAKQKKTSKVELRFLQSLAACN